MAVVETSARAGPVAPLSAVARRAPSLYFINWWADALIVGGLSLIVWAGLRIFVPLTLTPELDRVVLPLAILVNYPHFSATVYRFYQSPENFRQFPVTAWVVPLVLVGAVAACFWQPQVIAPYFIMLYLIWSPYHYSGQTVGLTMVYAKRAGLPIGRAERMALSAFVFSAFVCGVIGFQSLQAVNGYIDAGGIPVPAFAVPGWMYSATEAVTWSGAAVFAALAVAGCVRRRQVLPPIVLLPALAHYVWFVAGPGLKTFWPFIPFFHSLQYLLIAFAMQLKMRIEREGGDRSRPRIRAELARWGVRNILGGVVLFIALPAIVVWPSVPALTTAAVLVAAVNIHHFFVDGVIWKLRNPATASALTMNFAQVAGRAAAPVQRARA